MCTGYFIFIRPVKPDDNRAWLGFLSIEGGKGQHNHPNSGRKKIGEKLDELIAKAVEENPTLTAKDISHGDGIGCNPASISLPAVKMSSLQNSLKKAKSGQYSVCAAKDVLENFDQYVKKTYRRERHQ